jgi:hypothetical protein
MNNRLYTNTGKVGSILGLVVATVVLNYAAQHSTEIVNGTVAIAKSGVKAVKRGINNALTREVEVWSTLPNGEKFNTGMKVRVSKLHKTEAA